MKNKILQILLFATIVCSSTLNLSTVMAKTTVYNDNLNLTSGLSKKMFQNIYDSYTEIKIEKVYESKSWQNGWITANLNIRASPSLNSDILETYPFNTLIQYKKFNDDWAKIVYPDGVAYVSSKYISNEELNYKCYSVPLTSGFKSYMPYTAITSKSSPQYKLQQQCQTGLYGIRVKDERYCVAIGTGFNADVGTYFDLILANGTVIPCIVADIKSDKHTDSSHMVTKESGCLTEFVVDSGSLNKMAKKMGDISYCSDKWNSRVEKIRVYEKNIFKEVN